MNCILALKSYSEWKLKGGTGPFRYGSNMKNNFGSRKPFLRKSSEPFMSSMSRTDQPLCSDVGQVSEKVKMFCCYDMWWLLMKVYLFFTLQGDPRSINALVRSFISDRKPEDIPSVRILFVFAE